VYKKKMHEPTSCSAVPLERVSLGEIIGSQGFRLVLLVLLLSERARGFIPIPEIT